MEQSNSFLDKLPLPIAGVALGFATIGNALSMYPVWKGLFGLISGIIFILLIIKWIIKPEKIKHDLENPIIAASFATFPMCAMLLAGYLKPFFPQLGWILWYMGLFFHFCLLIYICIHFLPEIKKNTLAVYFVPSVGFVVASVTAPSFQAVRAGRVLFFLGLLFYVVLLIPVIKNIKSGTQKNPSLRPLKMIIAAPPNLCLAGYLTSFKQPKLNIIIGLSVVAVLSTLLCYSYFLKLNHHHFYPTFSAATFPMAISAVAMNKLTFFAQSQQWQFSFLFEIMTIIELLLAIFSCSYVLWRYLRSLVIHSRDLKVN